MSALTDLQLANLAALAGWSGDTRVTGIAIALAETGGHPTTDVEGDLALQTAKWGPSVGPWQIRSLKAQRGTGGVRDEEALKQPTHNAASAGQIYRDAGGKFTPWSTFLTGAYLLYLPRARAVAAQGSAEGGGSGEGVTRTDWGPLQAAADALTVVKHAGAWLGSADNWSRIALVVIGGGLVLGGLVVVARPAIDTAAKTAAIVK